MAINGDGQTGMDERVVEDSALAAALEKRLRAFKAADKAARDLIAKIDLEDGQAIRVGRFRISKTYIAGGYREFDTADRSQLSFELVA